MYTISPLPQFARIDCPSFILFVISAIGLIAHFPVALYSSPGIPSLPCDLICAKSQSSMSISCPLYSWSIHVSVSGSPVVILVRLACLRMTSMFSCTCIAPFPIHGHVCVIFFGRMIVCATLKHSSAHSPIFSSFRPFRGSRPHLSSSWRRFSVLVAALRLFW